MLNVSAFLPEKNKLSGKEFVRLFELRYDGDDPSTPVQDRLYFRFCQYDTNGAVDPVTFEGETYTPFPFAVGEASENTQGEIPAFDLVFSNVGREIQQALEFYDVEGLPGRVMRVHPDMLGDDTAVVETGFVVVRASANVRTATFTVAPVKFDPLGVKIPTKTVTRDEFPGVLGHKASYLL